MTVFLPQRNSYYWLIIFVKHFYFYLKKILEDMDK